MLALEKAMAEGTPNEMLIVLGWELNARRLLAKYTVLLVDSVAC